MQSLPLLSLFSLIKGEVSDRALREIYLKPFQIAIKDSNPRAVVTAYVFQAQDDFILTKRHLKGTIGSMVSMHLRIRGSCKTSYPKYETEQHSNELHLTKIQQEWGYKGLVMSDWTGTYSTAEAIKAGLDLEMPCVSICQESHTVCSFLNTSGPTVVRGPAVSRALISQKIFPADIDTRVRNVGHASNSKLTRATGLASIDPWLGQTCNRVGY